MYNNNNNNNNVNEKPPIVKLPCQYNNSDSTTTTISDIKDLSKFRNIYAGGFFDYLHCGHKIFLSIGLLLSKEKFFVSVLQKSPTISTNTTTTIPTATTESTTMKSNNNNEFTICSFGKVSNLSYEYFDKLNDDVTLPLEQRMKHVKSFLSIFAPNHSSIEVISNTRCSDINFCPMTYLTDVDAIIVIPSSINSAKKLNDIRSKRQLPLINIYQLDELKSTSTDNNSKISSTQIRELVKHKRLKILSQHNKMERNRETIYR
eukprot:gene7814-9617_t